MATVRPSTPSAVMHHISSSHRLCGDAPAHLRLGKRWLAWVRASGIDAMALRLARRRVASPPGAARRTHLVHLRDGTSARCLRSSRARFRGDASGNQQMFMLFSCGRGDFDSILRSTPVPAPLADAATRWCAAARIFSARMEPTLKDPDDSLVATCGLYAAPCCCRGESRAASDRGKSSPLGVGGRVVNTWLRARAPMALSPTARAPRSFRFMIVVYYTSFFLCNSLWALADARTDDGTVLADACGHRRASALVLALCGVGRAFIRREPFTSNHWSRDHGATAPPQRPRWFGTGKLLFELLLPARPHYDLGRARPNTRAASSPPLGSLAQPTPRCRAIRHVAPLISLFEVVAPFSRYRRRGRRSHATQYSIPRLVPPIPRSEASRHSCGPSSSRTTPPPSRGSP